MEIFLSETLTARQVYFILFFIGVNLDG
jgi:hypothetical protein